MISEMLMKCCGEVCLARKREICRTNSADGKLYSITTYIFPHSSAAGINKIKHYDCSLYASSTSIEVGHNTELKHTHHWILVNCLMYYNRLWNHFLFKAAPLRTFWTRSDFVPDTLSALPPFPWPCALFFVCCFCVHHLLLHVNLNYYGEKGTSFAFFSLPLLLPSL